jgi:hypothetical protein
LEKKIVAEQKLYMSYGDLINIPYQREVAVDRRLLSSATVQHLAKSVSGNTQHVPTLAVYCRAVEEDYKPWRTLA